MTVPPADKRKYYVVGPIVFLGVRAISHPLLLLKTQMQVRDVAVLVWPAGGRRHALACPTLVSVLWRRVLRVRKGSRGTPDGVRGVNVGLECCLISVTPRPRRRWRSARSTRCEKP